jgi:hypothetical protein
VRKRRYLLSKKLDDYEHPAARLPGEVNDDDDVDRHVDESPMIHHGRVIIFIFCMLFTTTK